MEMIFLKVGKRKCRLEVANLGRKLLLSCIDYIDAVFLEVSKILLYKIRKTTFLMSELFY